MMAPGKQRAFINRDPGIAGRKVSRINVVGQPGAHAGDLPTMPVQQVRCFAPMSLITADDGHRSVRFAGDRIGCQDRADIAPNAASHMGLSKILR